MVREIEKSKQLSSTVDLSQVVDLYDEEGMLEEITPDQLVIEVDEKEMMAKDKVKQRLLKKQGKDVKKEIKQRTEEEEEQFAQEYKKMGGIQHIICSATMTIDNSGRITPKMMKKLKKNGLN